MGLSQNNTFPTDATSTFSYELSITWQPVILTADPLIRLLQLTQLSWFKQEKMSSLPRISKEQGLQSAQKARTKEKWLSGEYFLIRY